MGILDKFKAFFTQPEIVANNPPAPVFANTQDNQANILSNSVIVNDLYKNKSVDSAQFEMINEYKNIIYGALSSDKLHRLRYYREMAESPEVSMATREYVDSFLTYDENGSYINFKVTKHGASTIVDEVYDIINDEAEHVMSLFDFESNKSWLVNFITDGEFCAENIIPEDEEMQREVGIIGINYMPNETYETIVDRHGNYIGVATNVVLSNSNNEQSAATTNALSRKFNSNITGNYQQRSSETSIIVMPFSQVTYANSGKTNNTKTIVYPILENARKAHRQLSLLEDSAIIYRLVRAPERLVFNVNTGDLPPAKAEEHLQKMMRKNAIKKVVDPNTGNISNSYDSHSMLENYWFAKSSEGGGTEVTTIGGNGNAFGELDDLKYFQKKLFMSLNVPFSRYLSDQAEIKVAGETLTNDEYRFNCAVISQECQLAAAIKRAFTTHLKIKGLYDEYKLNERMYNFQFNVPIMYDLYLKQKILEAKSTMYHAFNGDTEISKDMLQVDILGWSEDKVKINAIKSEAELIRKAMIDKRVKNMDEKGNPYDMTEPKG